ncbi:MAG: acetolactate synthase small subunit [Bacillota bacterium]|nr:acetolactate synthase small subunit [Bacillota bacterium]
MLHVLSVLTRNRSGVLMRVAGLFARRGFNIESLTVGTTENPDISRMTIVVQGDDRVIEQVTKQLYKLIDVVKIQDITDIPYVDRELVLFKVKVKPENRSEIMETVLHVFRARIVDISNDSLMIEATGDVGKIEAMESYLEPFGIKEMARTGKVALTRGAKNRRRK